ncbi:MAG: Phosphate-binding protein PstS 1 precursor [Deltaproteobacteria bacterium ADurb.Bin510]|nr:MAG: Phosphate-binding protein PstS 1 precursor [Deltaproteobacteria bacterium ADurb.Bin510]
MLKLHKTFMAFTVVACLAGPAAADQLTVKGSTTILPVAQAAAEIFMEKNPGAAISVQGGGSGIGIAALLEGTTDIAASSRKIKDEELAQAKAKGLNVQGATIALDGIAVIVNPRNKVDALTKAQILDIYTGKFSNWSQVGGPDQKIVVISRDSASGTYDAFDALALNKQKVRGDALMSASNGAVAQTVAQTPGAIGYVGLGYVNKKVKAVKVDGVACTKASVVAGTYPLSRPLILYTNGAPKGLALDFIRFIQGPSGQQLVDEEGFVRVKRR